MFKQYKGVAAIFKVYWAAYGGLGALLRSPYIHLSLVCLALTWNTWWAPTCVTGGGCAAWWDQNLSVLPNVLGFTLGGFAIFIGFGDEKFRALLAEDDGAPVNAYVALCATFVHFIVVQALALLVAVLAKAWWFYAPWMDGLRPALPILNGLGGAIGYGLFLYALCSVLAATMHIFRIAHMYARFQGQRPRVLRKPWVLRTRMHARFQERRPQGPENR